jgi:hypothetical protein
MARQQRLQLTEFGLNTIIGDLAAGPGALRVAHNVVVPASGRVEKVRGFKPVTRRTPYSAIPTTLAGQCANSIISSKTLGQNVLINGGVPSGSPVSIIEACSLLYGDGYTNPWWALDTIDNRTYLNDSYTRQKASVNQKTLFLTSQRTPLRLESGIERATTAAQASAQLSYAGMPQSPGIAWYQQFFNELVSVAGANWLQNGQYVAYRSVWGTVDADGNERLSAPSGRYIVGNVTQVRGYSAGADMCPQLSWQVPHATETNIIPIETLPTDLTHRRWFLRVYRSQVTVAPNATPDDEMQLCYEVWPTAAQVGSQRVQFTDTCPPAGLTAALYTNQVLGGDVNSGVLIAGNTALGLASKNDRPPIAKDTALFADCTFWANFTTPYRLTLAVLGVQATGGGPLLGPGDTVTISDQTGGTQVFTGVTGVPGSTGEFTIETGYSSLAINIRQTVMNLVGAINTQMSISEGGITAVYNGNDASPGTIGQFYLETIQQEYNPNTIATGTGLGSIGAFSSNSLPWLPQQQTDTGGSHGWYFTRDDAPNGLAISKPFQGDAVPPVNYLRVGRADTVIQRILPTTNALYILCDDGVYWLRGTAPTNFQIERLDPTCRIWWRESAVTLNDSVFLWAREGLFQIQNGSTIRLDTPIRGTVEGIRFNNDNAIVSRSNFAWANPFDNTVTFCWANWDTANAGAGGSPFQALIWNANTGAWSTRQMNNVISATWVTSKSCAVARWSDGAVFAGSPESIVSGGFIFTDVALSTGLGLPQYADWTALSDGSTTALSLTAVMEWVTSVPNPGSICHWSEFQAFSQPGSIVYSDGGTASLNLAYAVNEAGFNPVFPLVDSFVVKVSSEIQEYHTTATILPTSTQGRCLLATPGGYAVRQIVRLEHTNNAAGSPAGCAFTGFALVYRPISGRTTR